MERSITSPLAILGVQTIRHREKFVLNDRQNPERRGVGDVGLRGVASDDAMQLLAELIRRPGLRDLKGRVVHGGRLYRIPGFMGKGWRGIRGFR